ncbi:MAG: galactokinase [Treponema sp.]|nr:galactokinase [Treponema sp.]
MLDIGQIHRNEYELETFSDSSNDDDRLKYNIAIGEAPGRIHFLGELTPCQKSKQAKSDPESGFFLSAAIDRYIHVAVSMRKDNSFRFYAADLNERKRNTLVNLKYKREDRWANYLKPAIFLFTGLGYPMKGLNFSFCGDIPQQIGLASSTAIEVAAATALRSLLKIHINDMDLAYKLKEAHNDIFGKSTPLADYIAALCARKDQFLVIDTLDSAGSNDSTRGDVRLIQSPFARFRFLIIDSRVPRFGIEGEINSRRSDILKGLELLSKKRKGASFKDFASSDLLEVLGNFPEQIRRRSIHVVDEIHRVNDAADALERSDLASLAKIIYHSHESLRDLYEISCPEVDWLVKRAQEIEGAAGSRMTGLGFGGCTYTIIRRELVEEYKKRLEDYERIFGFRPVIYEFKLAAKARVIPSKKRVYA